MQFFFHVHNTANHAPATTGVEQIHLPVIRKTRFHSCLTFSPGPGPWPEAWTLGPGPRVPWFTDPGSGSQSPRPQGLGQGPRVRGRQVPDPLGPHPPVLDPEGVGGIGLFHGQMGHSTARWGIPRPGELDPCTAKLFSFQSGIQKSHSPG